MLLNDLLDMIVNLFQCVALHNGCRDANKTAPEDPILLFPSLLQSSCSPPPSDSGAPHSIAKLGPLRFSVAQLFPLKMLRKGGVGYSEPSPSSSPDDCRGAFLGRIPPRWQVQNHTLQMGSSHPPTSTNWALHGQSRARERLSHSGRQPEPEENCLVQTPKARCRSGWHRGHINNQFRP